MKKLSLIIVLALAIVAGFAQTFTEDFEGTTYNLTTGYTTGSFTNNVTNITWSYADCRDEGSYAINGKGVMLHNANPSYLEATFPNGVGTFTFQYRKAFTGQNTRQLELLVNGSQVATTTEYGGFSGADDTIHNFSHAVNTSGSVTIKIKNVGTSNQNRQTTLDNITWTEYSSTDPTLNVNTTPLTDFTYIVGNGPSTAQSFSVGGTNLTGDITVTAPTNFEVCLSENGTYSGSLTLTPTSGTVTSTDVYVRLAANLAVNTYSGNVECTSPGATTQNVSLSGSVDPVPGPTITVSETSLSGFTYVVDNGPSTAKTFSVGGSNLTDNITVTAPANYEVSTDGNTYSNTLTLTQAGGTVTATTINVRLAAGLTEGDYTGSIQCTSTGATAQNISLSGSVTSPPPPGYYVDFEGTGENTAGTGYYTGEKMLSGKNWNLNTVVIADSPLDGDWYDGTRSARLRGYAGTSMTMLEDKTNGAGTVSFQYRQYGTDTQTTWKVKYSTDQGSTWQEIPFDPPNNTFEATATVQLFSYDLNITGDIRLSIEEATGSGSNNKRMNIDNILITDYTGGAPTPTISVSPTSLTGFTYEVGQGPSTAQTISVGGSNLTDNITVAAPANFEVSTDGNTYSNTLTLTQAGGTVTATTINVRLAAGLTEGSYSGNVECTSPGATGKNVELSGSVTTPPLPPAPGYFVDFDADSEVKASFAGGSVILSGISWYFNEALVNHNTSDADWFEGVRSARLRGYPDSYMVMEADKQHGAGTISFEYCRYGTDTQTSWKVEYSTDGGTTWVEAGTNDSHIFTASDVVQTFTYELNTTQNIRLKISEASGSSGRRRLNIDNLLITDYHGEGVATYDFYDNEAKYVRNDKITVAGGNANYNYTATLGDLPEATFVPSFHRCLTLIGNGPWTFNIENATAQWAAYKQGGNWYSAAFEQGVATLTVDAAKNADIELLTGTGNNPTLPVELSHFSATMTAENYVQLTWTTQTETNLLGYNVYRSNSDNLSSAMQICHMIEGTNTSQAQTYVYVDKDLVEEGTYYYWLQNVDLGGSSAFHGPVSVVFSLTGDTGAPAVPTATKLDNAYPNPFNPSTTIRYQLEKAGKVKIDIYNTRGQLVRSFVQGHDAAGRYGIVWDGRDSSGKELSSGIYLYKMTSGEYSETKKMVLKK